ncbi:MAG: beta strand repeat-containing protein, partial [Chloroflexota bacterium]
MKKGLLSMKILSACLVILITLFSGMTGLNAATKTASVSGNWNSTTTWGNSAIPLSGDDVVINAGINVTATESTTCSSMTFVAGGSSSVSVNGGITLTVTGVITLNSGNNVSSALLDGNGLILCGAINVGDGNATTNNATYIHTLTSAIDVITITGDLLINSYSGNGNRRNNGAFVQSSGTITVNGSIKTTIGNSNNVATFTLGNSSPTLNLSGASAFSLATGSNIITLNGNGATVNYNRNGAQTVHTTTYNNLTISGSGIKTISGSTVNSVLSIEGTATASGTPTYGPNATLQYKGSAAQTTGFEFPSSFDGSGGVIINNSNGVTLSAAKAIGSTSKLTLTSGKIITTIANPITINNTASTAISGGSASSYIDGPIKWTLPASLVSGSTYNFPIGKGSVYLPFILVNPTTNTGIVTAQVEAFSGNPEGIIDGTLLSKSTTEYWSLITIGNFINSAVSIGRTTSITPMDAIGGSSNLAGTYTSLAGTLGTNGITNSNVIGTNRYFVLAQKKLPITTGTINGSPLCAGTTVSIPYSISTSFNAGNIFTAQLSNATGSFTSPVNVGTLNSTNGGSISATIPAATEAGTGYRIRVVSSNPVITGSVNGTDLIINARLSAVTVSPGGAQNICGSTSGSPLTATEIGGGTIIGRQWGKRTSTGGAITAIAGATGQTYTPGTADLAPGTWYIVCTSTPTCGSAIVSNEVAVTVSAIPNAPTVGSITQPGCTVATGSVQLTGLPASGSWTLTRNPGGTTTTGSGTSTVISGLGTGTYTFTVTNSSGCTSTSSSNVVINAQPISPTITGTMSSSRCGSGTLTLSATASEGTVNWYSKEIGGSLLATGNNFTTPRLTASTNYYVEANDGVCISSSRVAVAATIITPPSITAMGSGTFCAGSNVNLYSSSTDITNQYWTGPNSYYSLLPNPVVSNVTPSMSGTYRVTGSALSGINLIINGDFEMGATGFTSDYTRAAQTATGLDPEGTYDIVAAPSSRHTNFCSCSDHTSNSGTLQMVVNGASAEKIIWSQKVNVNPTTAYQFTYWVQTVVNGNDASPSKLQLYVNNKFAGPVYTANPTTGVWTQFTYNWVSGSEDIAANLELRNENFVANGNDFALDDIVFQQACEVYDEVTVNVNDEVTAGSISSSQTICSGSIPGTLTSVVAGTGSGTISYEWESNASGNYVTITGATSSSYMPPALTSTTSYRRRTVANNGGVTCYSGYTNEITITVNGPAAIAGGPNTVCQSANPAPITLSGASYSGGATSAAWSIITGGGSLSSSAQTTTPSSVTYTPAANYSGTVVLRLTTSASPCSAIAERIINVFPPATAFAGNPILTCTNSGEVNIFDGANASNQTSILWTSNGTGTLTNATSLTLATYTPSAADLVIGEVTLTLTAFSNAPCGDVSSTKKIVINKDGTWTGTINRDWNNTANWACNQLPTLTTNVTIASGLVNYPIVSTSPAGMARDISIAGGASVAVNGGTLQIANDLAIASSASVTV